MTHQNGEGEHRFADWYEAHGKFLGIGRASCHIIYAAAIKPFKGDVPSMDDLRHLKEKISLQDNSEPSSTSGGIAATATEEEVGGKEASTASDAEVPQMALPVALREFLKRKLWDRNSLYDTSEHQAAEMHNEAMEELARFLYTAFESAESAIHAGLRVEEALRCRLEEQGMRDLSENVTSADNAPEVSLSKSGSAAARPASHVLQVVDKGHSYLLPSFDGGTSQSLIFMKREGVGYPGNVGCYPGTNLQSVLRACLDRVVYLHNQIPHDNNLAIASHLKHCLLALEQRAAERHGRNPRSITLDRASFGPMCAVCGHVVCDHAPSVRDVNEERPTPPVNPTSRAPSAAGAVEKPEDAREDSGH